MKKFLLAALLALAPVGALAQGSGTIPAHSIPISKGPGVAGWAAGGPCTAGQTLVWSGITSNPTCQDATGSGFANPTAQVGLAAVNGTATTGMRSDAAPALDQSISPTWTGKHTFSQSLGGNLGVDGSVTAAGGQVSSNSPSASAPALSGTKTSTTVYSGIYDPVFAIAANGAANDGALMRWCTSGICNTFGTRKGVADTYYTENVTGTPVDVFKISNTGDYFALTGINFPGATSGNVKISAPAVAGSTTFQLPASNGTSGQGLITDGAGHTSWSSVAGGTAVQVFRPEDYGAPSTCNASFDATSAINQAITAAETASASTGTAQLLFQCPYKTTSNIIVPNWTGTLYWKFTGSAGFNLVSATSSTQALQFNYAGFGGFSTLAANVATGAKSVTVNSAAAFTVGGYVDVYGSTGIGTYIHHQLDRIVGIAGNVLTLDQPIQFPITIATAMPAGYSSASPYVQAVTMGTGRLIMDGGTFSGVGVSGSAVTGILMEGLVAPQVSNVTTTAFNTTNSAAWSIQYVYGGSFEYLYDTLSGQGGATASINLNVVTDITFDNIKSLNAAGFGILIDYMYGSRESNITSTGAVGGRGLKHWSNCGNIQVNTTANNNAYTGNDYDSVSCNNRSSNVTANNNLNEGLIFLGAGDTGNYVSGVNAHNNATTDIAFAGSVSPDSNNQVVGANIDATVFTAGGVVNSTVSKIGAPNLNPFSGFLSSNVALNTTSFTDGPAVSQGSIGTWYASGTVTLIDSAASGNILCKLWDGTTAIASTVGFASTANYNEVALSGVLTNPAGNLRISCKASSSSTARMSANDSGSARDSTITAFRVN